MNNIAGILFAIDKYAGVHWNRIAWVIKKYEKEIAEIVWHLGKMRGLT